VRFYEAEADSLVVVSDAVVPQLLGHLAHAAGLLLRPRWTQRPRGRRGLQMVSALLMMLIVLSNVSEVSVHSTLNFLTKGSTTAAVCFKFVN
jgi:hypothetical protein